MKALIVDDDVVSRIALMDLLSVYGIFDMIEADDGAAAWELLEQGLRPLICFCDVRMPRMSGIALLERMKSDPRLAEVPFVLVSSASDRDTVLQAVTLGAVGYILKPLHEGEARAHLEKIFRITLDKLAEDPQATLKRLNIGAERLATYLNGFGGQVAQSREEIKKQLQAGAVPDARKRIDLLHTGCMTLGLWNAAARIDATRNAAPDSARIGAAIDVVGEAVDSQLRRLQGSSAAGPAGA